MMNETLQIAPPQLPPTDPLEGEPELRRELAELFLEDFSRQLSTIRRLIDDRNARDLQREAHTLKGSAGVFRDQAAFGAAFQMEMFGRDAAWDSTEGAWEALLAETLRLARVLKQLVSGGQACTASTVLPS
jgi:HPt (histidine-containing phosphotransfer) domain-containing protein